MTVPLRRRAVRPTPPIPAILRRIAYPAVVLLLTWGASSLEGSWSLGADDSAVRRLQAWNLYWFVVLAVTFLDGLIRVSLARRGQGDPVPPLLRGSLLFVVYLGAALTVLRVGLSVDITPLLATSAILTMVVGLALQGVLGNLLAGVSLNLVRSVEVGNLIRVKDHEGIVVRTNWRETILRTRDHDFVHVPNNLLATEAFLNFSKPEKLHRHVLEVGASYSDAPGDVIEALVAAAREGSHTLDHPAPSAVVSAFLDFGINYRLMYFSENYWQRFKVEGEVARLVWYKFKRRGIEIPFPMSDQLLNDFMAVVYNQRRLPPAEADVRRMVTVLSASSFLVRADDGGSLLDESATRELAADCRLVRYTPGEILCRQGESGEACYVVASGSIAGSVEHEEGGRRHTSEFTIESGSLFGEISLLTGVARTATGRITEETELLEIPQSAFARLLARDESVADDIARLVAARSEENKEFLDELASMPRGEIEKSDDSRKIMERLRALASWGKKLIAE